MSLPVTEHRLSQQRAIYGSPLAERFGAVMAAYGLSQRSLARVLGLSAPMLSQLINAQRIKIGNPAVYERLVLLEELQDQPDPEHVLAEVQASEPVLTTHASRARVPDTGRRPGGEVVVPLSRLAGRAPLLAAAEAARQAGSEGLALALEQAAALSRVD
ncbi:DNA-binding protein [Citricoccus sp. SGAir0253]|uniref:DNA-binding protein n=1 Tax=Citricoccus sp. SGAir0253 TaxID=2567881 RepID=UPI0010CCCB4C|nr:DNA-binding protein [Citricoccus sp. SGAir0253]QCU76842.1 DNA-binding protein [Citricoccus sp. SGAir0253]